MGDLLGPILEGVGHALVELANWIPAPRWNSISPAWAWPIAICLVVGFIALVAALWLGDAWFYQLTVGAFVSAFGLVCIGALCSRPSQGG